jgi:iron only hydrogenase large subunit-like protein
MNEVNSLIQALNEKKKLVAILAPSFPIVFSYPSIIAMLRKLGFSYVVEVSLGARKTNEQLAKLLKDNPNDRYITSPCPTVVRMMRQQLPQYVKYFTHDVDSPMVASVKIAKEKYPDCQPVFIGPCIVKKLEAKEDNPDLNILVITYAELSQVFEKFNIKEELGVQDQFDLAGEGMTRIYPIDGGLAFSSGLMQSSEPGTIKRVSGWNNCMQAIKDFDVNPKVKVLDILFCNGGCVSGPGIKSTLNFEERKKKILDFAAVKVADDF